MGLQFIVRNWRLKLVALAVACGMWVAVVYAGNPPAVRTVYVKVQVTGKSSSLLLLRTIDPVPVKVYGILSNVTTSVVAPHLFASVNLQKIKGPGQYSVRLKYANTDPSIAVLSEPTSVQVLVDEWKTETLAVHAVPEKPPPSGYSLASPLSASPKTVTVRAPSSILSTLVADADVDLSAYRTPVSVSTRVTFVNDPGGKATANPSAVAVRADITTNNITRSTTAFVKTTGSVPFGYQLVSATPTPLTFSVTGPEATLNQLATVNTVPIDISSITADTTEQVQLDIPAGVTASVTSVTVTIIVVALPTATPTPTPTPATPTPTPSS
jgi:YbbR domain-containing protein